MGCCRYFHPLACIADADAEIEIESFGWLTYFPQAEINLWTKRKHTNRKAYSKLPTNPPIQYQTQPAADIIVVGV